MSSVHSRSRACRFAVCTPCKLVSIFFFVELLYLCFGVVVIWLFDRLSPRVFSSFDVCCFSSAALGRGGACLVGNICVAFVSVKPRQTRPSFLLLFSILARVTEGEGTARVEDGVDLIGGQKSKKEGREKFSSGARFINGQKLVLGTRPPRAPPQLSF